MLPPFIIDQIRRREEEVERLRQSREQPRLELPVAPREPRTETPVDEEHERGVVILDLG